MLSDQMFAPCRPAKSWEVRVLSLLAVITALYFYLNPIADFLGLYFSSIGYSFARLSLVSRGVLTGLIVLLSLHLVLKSKGGIGLFVVLIYSVFISAVWFSAGLYDAGALVETINIVVKIIIPFVFYYMLLFVQSMPARAELIRRSVRISIFVYLLFVIVGAVFNILEFKSYGEIRYGYKGVIAAQNEASAFVLISLLIFGLPIVQKQHKKTDIIGFALSSISAVLLGTKAGAVLPIIAVALIIVSRVGLYKATPYVAICTAAFLVISSLLVSFSSFFGKMFSTNMEYFKYQFEYHASGSLVTLFLSGRDMKISYIFDQIFGENPLYFVFGGYPVSVYSPEIDFIEIALITGLPIFVLYFYMLKSIFFIKGGGVKSNYLFYSFLIVVFLANTGGHLLTSGLALPYLAYFCATSKISSVGRS